MKKSLFIAILAICTVSFSTSCNTYRSNTSGVNTQLLKKVGTALISDLGTSVLSNAIGGSKLGNTLKMGTKLNSIIKGASMVSSLKNMLSSKYSIPMTKVNSAYGTFKTVKDLAGFVTKNGSSSILSKL